MQRVYLFCLLSFLIGPLASAQERPHPDPVDLPPAYEWAVERGTRTSDGAPGPEYWANGAEYDYEVVLSEETKMLRGRGTARYINRSPDTLGVVWVHLRQNLHKAGTVRNRHQQLTGGMEVADVRYEGSPLVERTGVGKPGYEIHDTRMRIELPTPIAPGETAGFDFSWSFQVPGEGAPRIGQDGEIFFVGYFYPQFAVYDDVWGWTAEPYMGDGEFYMDFADYEIAITVPEGMLVGATGVLINPEEVLTERTMKRLERTSFGETVVNIVTEDERQAGVSTRDVPGDLLTWRFRAEDARDFAFGASRHYVWDAMQAHTGDEQDGSTMIHALYRPGTPSWERAAAFTAFSIEHLSEMLVPYPYPHMTAVEGVIGGMEFPMITHIGRERSYESLFSVLYHEISHMWLPMLVGSDEKHYAWMDEGTTTYNEHIGFSDFFGEQPWQSMVPYYAGIAGTREEQPSMRHADRYPVDGPSRGIASYTKPALTLRALEGVLGSETFQEAYRTYIRRWMYKHATPYDLFNTFEDVSGEELDWFFTSFLFETWELDHAIEQVEETAEGIVVTVRDEGDVPYPAVVRATYADGSTEDRTVEVGIWLEGERQATLQFPSGEVERIELDPGDFAPDVDPSDDGWSADEVARR